MQIVLAACSLYESSASDLSRIEKHFDRAGMGLVQCIVAHDLVMRVIEYLAETGIWSGTLQMICDQRM